MSSAASSRGWMVPVVALCLATFAINTAELIVTGLLPPLAADLGVDIPTAGLLITGYALGVAIASPVLALVTGGFHRRTLLIAVTVAFVLGNTLCALATSYWTLLGARLLVAGCHGLFFGVAMVVTMRLAPPGRQTSAVSLVIAGVTIANVLGVPLGTAIGNAYSWRAPFWVIALAGAAAAVAIVLLVPSAPEAASTKSNLRDEIRATLRPVVLMSYGIITLFMIGVIAFLTYIVPVLTSAGVPNAYVPWVLFGMGFFGFFGNLVGGRLGDWNPTVTMVGILCWVIVMWIIMVPASGNPWTLVLTIWSAWLVGFGFPAPVEARILNEASDAPNFASTVISTAFNIGIAAGAAIGAAAIAAGWSYAQLPWISAIFFGLALCGTLGLLAYDRRLKTSPA